MTHLLSSGEFCKLYYDTIPVKSASANVSFCTSNSKMPNFELWHLSETSDTVMTGQVHVTTDLPQGNIPDTHGI